jgi:hypothetical protein
VNSNPIVVLEGSATLVLGGKLDAPKEVEPVNGALQKSSTARLLKSPKAIWSSCRAARHTNAAPPIKTSR